MSRTLKISIGVILALFIGWYLASPYIAVHQIKSAAQSRDAEALSEHIDFPALKESVKASMSASIMSNASKSSSDEPFAAAGSALALAMIGPMVDAMITPQAIAMMMQGEEPLSDQQQVEPSAPKQDPDISSSYKDLDTFVITLKDNDKAKESASFILKRHGLFTWKLAALEFPM